MDQILIGEAKEIWDIADVPEKIDFGKREAKKEPMGVTRNIRKVLVDDWTRDRRCDHLLGVSNTHQRSRWSNNSRNCLCITDDKN
jgi:hypothetical protein